MLENEAAEHFESVKINLNCWFEERKRKTEASFVHTTINEPTKSKVKLKSSEIVLKINSKYIVEYGAKAKGRKTVAKQANECVSVLWVVSYFNIFATFTSF